MIGAQKILKLTTWPRDAPIIGR